MRIYFALNQFRSFLPASAIVALVLGAALPSPGKVATRRHAVPVALNESGPGEFDSAPAGSGAFTNINAPAPILSITKSHTGDFTTGQPGTYNIAVSNTGTAPTSGIVTLRDILPQGMTGIAVDAPGLSCSPPPASFFDCTRSDALAPGSSYPGLIVTVSVGNSAPMVTNSASVAGGGDSLFHTVDDPTNVHTPTLALTVSHTGDFTVGQTGTYTLTVTNTGNLATLGTVIARDPLPVPDLTAN